MKIRLTQKNFTKYLSQNLEKPGFDSMFLNALSGGKAKELVSKMPDEQKVIIDTKYVASVGQLTQFEETGDIVFQIFFSGLDKEHQHLWFKGEEYMAFLCAWLLTDEEEYDNSAIVDITAGTMQWKHSFATYAAHVKTVREAYGNSQDPGMYDALCQLEEELKEADKLADVFRRTKAFEKKKD